MFKSAPERIRTTNLLIRSQMLYPVELRAQNRNLPMKWHDDMNKLCRFKP
jgi:hypothetical protein